MQPMGRLSMHSLSALVFSFWGGWGQFVLFFFLVQSLPMPLARAKNGDQQFWKPKIHAANG
jgi:hypothetical protein